MGDVARSIASAVGFDTNDKLVRALQFDSPELELSREEFAQMLRQNCFLVRTFQEGHGMKATSFGGFNEKVANSAQYLDSYSLTTRLFSICHPRLMTQGSVPKLSTKIMWTCADSRGQTILGTAKLAVS